MSPGHPACNTTVYSFYFLAFLEGICARRHRLSQDDHQDDGNCGAVRVRICVHSQWTCSIVIIFALAVASIGVQLQWWRAQMHVPLSRCSPHVQCTVRAG